MESLVQNLKTEDALQQIYQATEAIIDRLPDRSKLLVAETINGRSAIEYRTGLVFLALELNREELAQRFLEIAVALLTSARTAGIETERCDRALAVSREIRDILEHPERPRTVYRLDDLAADPSPQEGGFVGLLRVVVLIAVVVGAVGSVGFVLFGGRGDLSCLVLPLLTIWVLLPFVALLWVNVESKYWPAPTRVAFYGTTLVLTLGSLAVYREVAFGGLKLTPAFVYLVVPLGSWLLMVLFVPIAASMSD